MPGSVEVCRPPDHPDAAQLRQQGSVPDPGLRRPQERRVARAEQSQPGTDRRDQRMCLSFHRSLPRSHGVNTTPSSAYAVVYRPDWITANSPPSARTERKLRMRTSTPSAARSTGLISLRNSMGAAGQLVPHADVRHPSAEKDEGNEPVEKAAGDLGTQVAVHGVRRQVEEVVAHLGAGGVREGQPAEFHPRVQSTEQAGVPLRVRPQEEAAAEVLGHAPKGELAPGGKADLEGGAEEELARCTGSWMASIAFGGSVIAPKYVSRAGRSPRRSCGSSLSGLTGREAGSPPRSRKRPRDLCSRGGCPTARLSAPARSC